MKVVQISKEINPHFYDLWTTDKPYIVAKGGRGSFKSSVISLKLVTMMMQEISKGHQVNIISIRENANYLRDSVYNQIIWALNILGVDTEFRTRFSPLTITHIVSGSTFYFYGANDPMKLKSNIVGNVIAVWFEEFANLKSIDVFDQSVPTFIRQKPDFVDQCTVFCSYNPPRNPYLWVNEWIKEREHDPNYFIDTSTYLDDELGFTTKQQLDLINQYKKNDPDYYRWLYLGEVIGLGTNVYNMDLFHVIDELPDDDPITAIYAGMDNGWEVSATTVVVAGLSIKGNIYILDTWYYSPAGKVNKKAPSDIAPDIHNFLDKISTKYDMYPANITMDSAEGAFDAQYYRQFGTRWSKVKKLIKPEMISRVQDLLAQGRVYVLNIPDNDIFMAEHRKYQWDANTLQSDSPEVIKVDDHTCDAFQYLVRDNERELGIKY